MRVKFNKLIATIVFTLVFLSAACSVQVQCLNGSILILELEDETGLVYKGRDLSELNLKGIFTGDTI